VTLLSRNAKSLTDRYPGAIEALQHLPADRAVLDGEIVAVDQEGRSSFQLLQSYLSPGGRKPPLFYYVFDLLNLEGNQLLQLPLIERKALLQKLLAGLPETVRFSPSLPGHSKRLLQEMRKRGLEGVIAKRAVSPYEPGRRSGAWVKFKWSQ